MIEYTENSIIISTPYIEIEFMDGRFIIVRQDREMYPDWNFSITDSTRQLAIHSCFCPEFRYDCCRESNERRGYALYGNTISKIFDMEISTSGNMRWGVNNMLFLSGDSGRKVGSLPLDFLSRYKHIVFKANSLFEKYESIKLGEKFYDYVDI